MALSGMFTLLGARGINSISASFKKKKIEKKLKNNEKLGVEDILWLCFYYKDIKRDFDKAEYFVKEAIILEPDNNNIKSHYLEICFLNSNFSKAKEILEYFINKGIGEIGTNYYNLGYMYYLLGNIEQSNKYREKAIGVNPEFKSSKYEKLSPS